MEYNKDCINSPLCKSTRAMFDNFYNFENENEQGDSTTLSVQNKFLKYLNASIIIDPLELSDEIHKPKTKFTNLIFTLLCGNFLL
jgi:hypothetical protein